LKPSLSIIPSNIPSVNPSFSPSGGANSIPSSVPSIIPSNLPSVSSIPSSVPSLKLNIGKAGRFAVLAKNGITIDAGSSILGDVGNFPSPVATLVGFGQTINTFNTFYTSIFVNGNIYATGISDVDYLLGANAAVESAIATAKALPPDTFVSGAEDLAGRTYTAGVYKWGGALGLSTTVTFDGSPEDVFIMITAGAFTPAASAKVLLVNGAKAENVFWVVGGAVSTGSTSDIQGVILGEAAVTLGAGSKLTGAVLTTDVVTIASTEIVKSSVCDPDSDPLITCSTGLATSSSPSKEDSDEPTDTPTASPSYDPTLSQSAAPTFSVPDYNFIPYERVGPVKRDGCKALEEDGIPACKDEICRGDCEDHADCNDFSFDANGCEGKTVGSLSVCVQDPSGPLGPCRGDPQGEENYKAIIADPENNIPSRPKWTAAQNIDYCIPACRELIELIISENFEDTTRINAKKYGEICGVPNSSEPTPIISSSSDTSSDDTSTTNINSSGPTTGKPCCSQNFVVCDYNCPAAVNAKNNGIEITKDICENQCSGSLRLLEKGKPELDELGNDQCLKRYFDNCDGESKPCCSPGECIVQSEFYSQCIG